MPVVPAERDGVADPLQRDDLHQPVVDRRRVSLGDRALHPRAGKPSRNSLEEVDRPRYKRRIGYSSKMLDAGAVDRRTSTGCFGCHQQWRSSTPNRSVKREIDREMPAFDPVRTLRLLSAAGR